MAGGEPRREGADCGGAKVSPRRRSGASHPLRRGGALAEPGHEAAGVRVAKGVRREGIIDDIRVSIRGVPRVAQAPTSPLDRWSGSGFVRDPLEASRVLCS